MNYSTVYKSRSKSSPRPREDSAGLDQFADNVGPYSYLRKELRKFIMEWQRTFLDLREETFHWSGEEDRPQRNMPNLPVSQEVAASTPNHSTKCGASPILTPTEKMCKDLLIKATEMEARTQKYTKKMKWTAPKH